MSGTQAASAEFVPFKSVGNRGRPGFRSFLYIIHLPLGPQGHRGTGHRGTDYALGPDYPES